MGNVQQIPGMPPLRGLQPVMESRSGVDDIKKEFNEGAKIASFFRGMNAGGLDGVGMVQQGQRQGKTEVKESTSVDLGAAFKAITEHSQNVSKQLIDVAKESKSGGQDKFLDHMINEFKDMRTQLNQAIANPNKQQDPAELMLKTMESYGKLMEGLKKDMRLPDSVNLNPGNLNVAVELKRLELEMLDRQWKYDNDKADRALERASEERRWMAEMGLKREELQGQLDRSNQAAGVLQDLMASVAAAIDKPGMPPIAAQPPRPRPQAYFPTELKCGGCGTIVPIPKPPPARLECPSCQMVYSLGDDDEPEEQIREVVREQAREQVPEQVREPVQQLHQIDLGVL